MANDTASQVLGGGHKSASAARLAVASITTAAVALHNELSGTLAARPVLLLAAVFAAYCAIFWLTQRFYYGAPRALGAFDLEWFFDRADLFVLGFALFVSVGDPTWLAFIFLVPVWNQTLSSARRAAVCGALAAAIYFAILLYQWSVEHRAISMGNAAFGSILLLLMAAYCAFTPAVAARIRNAERQPIHLTALNRLSRIVTSTTDLRAMLDAIAAEILEFMNQSTCAITRFDAKASLLEVVACRSVRHDASSILGVRSPKDQNPACQSAIESRKPVVVPASQASSLASTADAFTALGVQSLMSVPIISQNEVIGTINIYRDDATRSFSEDETEVAIMAAAQVAALIRHAQIYDDEKRSRELTERLQSVGYALTQSLDLDEVLQNLLQHVHDVIDCNAGSVQLLEGDAMRVVAVHGYDESEVGKLRPLADYAFNNHLAHHPEALCLPVPNPLWVQEPGVKRKLRTVIGVPLIVHDRIIGAMTIDSHEENAYDERDVQTAVAFARFAAIAVEHASLYAAMQELSILDPLTQVANRRHLDNLLETEWRRAMRSRVPFSLIMIDVDHFKAYNDRYGHPAGDSVLQQVALALRDSLQRTGELVARYGGEEFVLLLPSADHAEAVRCGEALRSRIEQLQIAHAGSGAEVVTISAGAATAIPNDDLTPRALIDAADRQLYAAKHSGRNRVCAIEIGDPVGENDAAANP